MRIYCIVCGSIVRGFLLSLTETEKPLFFTETEEYLFPFNFLKNKKLYFICIWISGTGASQIGGRLNLTMRLKDVTTMQCRNIHH